MGTAVLVTCLLAGGTPRGPFPASCRLSASAVRYAAAQFKKLSPQRPYRIPVYVSLLFIIGTTMVGRQIHYMLNTDWGLTRMLSLRSAFPGASPKTRKRYWLRSPKARRGAAVSLSTASPEAAGHGITNLNTKARRT